MALVKNSEVDQKPCSSRGGFLLGISIGPHNSCYTPLGQKLKKTWCELFPGTMRESGCGWKLIRHSPDSRGSGTTSEHLPSQNALAEVGPLQAELEGHLGDTFFSP